MPQQDKHHSPQTIAPIGGDRYAVSLFYDNGNEGVSQAYSVHGVTYSDGQVRPTYLAPAGRPAASCARVAQAPQASPRNSSANTQDRILFSAEVREERRSGATSWGQPPAVAGAGNERSGNALGPVYPTRMRDALDALLAGL
jgi:hypothetical protein